MTLPSHYSEEDRFAAEALRRSASGDTAAMESLYRLYARPLLAVLCGIVGQRQEAEDLLQDVWVRCWRQAGRFESAKGTPFGWLLTIARRMALDYLRKKGRQPQIISLDREQGALQEDQKSEDWRHGGEIALDLEKLWQDGAGLSESQRRALELAYFGGLTHHDIAAKTGKPLGTVKSDLRRGLQALRKRFWGNEDGS